MKDKKELFSQEWERYVIVFLIALLPLFTRIYADIRREYGGGKPAQAILYFSATQQFVPTNCANILLIEETDVGYYVVLRSGSDDAFFIRRDQVSAVRFSKNTDQACR